VKKYSTIYYAFKLGESDKMNGLRLDNVYTDKPRRKAYLNGYNSATAVKKVKRG